MCQRLDGIFVRALDLLWKFGGQFTTPRPSKGRTFGMTAVV